MKMKRKKKNEPKKSFREQLSSALELPQEVVEDLPIIHLVGNKEVSVENFNGLAEYTDKRIRLNTKSGTLSIDGIALEAKSMTAEVIHIKGTILQIGFIV